MLNKLFINNEATFGTKIASIICPSLLNIMDFVFLIHN